MSLQLSMIGLVVQDMGTSLEFYRRLGLALPEGGEGRPHVELKMEIAPTFFWDTAFVRTYDPERAEASDGHRVLLEFYVASRDAVAATYAELTGLGYRGRRAPFETSFGAYMAMVDDPDGNTVLVTA